MDGIISAPICVAGFFLLPDLPENTRAFYLSEDVGIHPREARTQPNIDQDRSLGRKRMEAVGRAPRQKLTLATLRRIFSENKHASRTDTIPNHLQVVGTSTSLLSCTSSSSTLDPPAASTLSHFG